MKGSVDSFRTEYKVRSRAEFSPYSGVTLLGSCFADNIGGKLRESLAPVCVNPVGPLFNAKSISRALAIACGDAAIRWFEKDGERRSWDAAAAYDAEAGYAELRRGLENSEVVIITLGTAIVYEYEGVAVANCHKMAGGMFERRMMSVSEVVGCLREGFERLKDKRIIMTVSPVRHLKEGFESNSISKATLRLAAAELSEMDNVEYFAAYEIIMDDLRDYRFCADDMQHPSAQAVEYVWQKFRATYFNEVTEGQVAEGTALSRRMAHRPMNPQSAAAQAFCAETEELVRAFKERLEV